MTPEYVQIMINRAIEQIPNFEILFEKEVLKMVITPKKEQYSNALNEEVKFECWTILIDYKNKKRVFYLEKDNLFGLGAITDKNKLINLGYYGSFIEIIAAL
jgi:hypothetical protein